MWFVKGRVEIVLQGWTECLASSYVASDLEPNRAGYLCSFFWLERGQEPISGPQIKFARIWQVKSEHFLLFGQTIQIYIGLRISIAHSTQTTFVQYYKLIMIIQIVFTRVLFIFYL